MNSPSSSAKEKPEQQTQQQQEPTQPTQDAQQQQPPASQPKRGSLNGAQLCRMGASLVDDLASRLEDTFQQMAAALSRRHPQPASLEALVRRAAHLRTAAPKSFALLRLIDRQVSCLLREVDQPLPEALIPLKEDSDSEEDSEDEDDENEIADQSASFLPSFSAVSQSAWERRVAGVAESSPLAALKATHQALLAHSQLQNRQLRQTIERLRTLLWDVNSMLAASR